MPTSNAIGNRHELMIKELHAAFQEGIESGQRIPAEEVFAELKARYREAPRAETSESRSHQ